MRVQRTLRSLLIPGLLALASTPSFASSPDIALGAEGALYRIRTGTYAEFFPRGTAAAPSEVVLALETTRPGALPTLDLVPSTGADAVESSPSLFFENASKSVFVVWESRINPLHSVLNLASRSSSGWSSVLSISGDRYSFKTAPRIAVTHDTVERLGATGSGTELLQRTIVHTVWLEDSPTGIRSAYSPVVLLNGEYIGWNPVYALSEFVASPRAAIDPNDTIHIPTIHAGRDQASVVAAFVSSDSGRLHALEIGVLPGDLTLLANRIRAKILTFGRIPTGNNLTVFADTIRTELIDLGTGLHPSVRQFLAEQIRAKIIEVAPRLNPGQLRRLGDEIKTELIDLGAAAIRGGGLTHLPNYATGGSDSQYQIEAVVETPNVEPSPQSPENSLAIRAALDLPNPDTAGQAASIFTSDTGAAALVSWVSQGQVRYRESDGASWTDVLSLPRGLEADMVELVLSQRIRNR